MKVYFGGCKGIQSPVDIDGNQINEGDLLTFDYGDFEKKPEGWEDKAVFIVERHKSGGLCAVGLITKSSGARLYLHDFRFKFCKKVAA